MWVEIGDERHRLMFIEYRHRKPFGVITLKAWKYRDGSTGLCPQYFDFNWCKTDQSLYWHNSGGGGSSLEGVHLGRFLDPIPRQLFWAAPELRLTTSVADGDGFKNVEMSEADIYEMGYQRIKRPLLLDLPHHNKSRNPFDVSGGDTETVYCEKCDDHFPSEDNSPCDHLEWCDLCCDFVYSDGHKRQDDGEAVVHTEEELENV